MRIVLHGSITAVGKEAHRKWASGTGSDAIFEDQPSTWYLVINHTLRIGDLAERPEYEIGDKVTFTLTKDTVHVEPPRKDDPTPHRG